LGENGVDILAGSSQPGREILVCQSSPPGQFVLATTFFSESSCRNPVTGTTRQSPHRPRCAPRSSMTAAP
jgi:hypothetical protein